MSPDDDTKILPPVSSGAFRHEAGNHGERIARLESDVWNITQLISGDVHEKLVALQAGVDTVKDTLGVGHVMFQELKDAHVANMVEINSIKENRRVESEREEARKAGRVWYLVYPAALVALACWLQHLFGGGGK